MTAGGRDWGCCCPHRGVWVPQGNPQYPGAFSEVSPTPRTSLSCEPFTIVPMGTGTICTQVFPHPKASFAS